MKKSITEHKKDATLNKVFRYPEGEMTRRDWLNMWRIKGATVRVEDVRNHVAEEKLRQWIYDNRGMNSGNVNYPPTKLWLSEKERLKNKIYKTVFRLDLPNGTGLYEITKTEYDHFNDLELAEDISTEKHALQNSIEAGTATDEEIETDMQNDIDEMKYYIEDKNPYEPPNS